MKSHQNLEKKGITLHINALIMQLTLFFVPKKVVGQISHHNSTFEDAREIKKKLGWQLKWAQMASLFFWLFLQFFFWQNFFWREKDLEISIIINTPFENWIRLPKCDKVHERDSPLANNDISANYCVFHWFEDC